MKAAAVCISIIVLFTTCKKEPGELLVQRWNFVAVDFPHIGTFVSEVEAAGEGPEITMKKFFLDNKLILRIDSSFDMVLLKHYIHGTWKYNKQTKDIFLNDESANGINIQFSTDTVQPYELHLATDEFTLEKIIRLHADANGFNYLLNKQYYQFFLEAGRNRFSGLSEDLYSEENNWWRIKPLQSETEEQIKKRVLNHLAFWQLLFHDADENNRGYVSYNWFTSPLVVADNGAILKFYDEVKTGWDQNFFDSTQAHKGYDLMRKCFSKKIKYMQTENKYQRNEDIIKQLTENLLTATKR